MPTDSTLISAEATIFASGVIGVGGVCTLWLVWCMVLNVRRHLQQPGNVPLSHPVDQAQDL